MNTDRLANLAALMNLTAAQAVALPTAVTVAARKVGISETDFVTNMESNRPLRDYVAIACAKAA